MGSSRDLQRFGGNAGQEGPEGGVLLFADILAVASGFWRQRACAGRRGQRRTGRCHFQALVQAGGKQHARLY